MRRVRPGQAPGEGLRCSAMRVVDLDRDMSDVIPTGLTPDSEFLFDRMTKVTLDRTLAAPGQWILDVASGVGQDSIALAGRGARVVGAEPSGRMTGMAQLFAADKPGPMPDWVRGWSDRLPFAQGSFDACICKGAMDHFDAPEVAIAEMARVTSTRGRVVLAIANFESLACRVGRGLDDLRQDVLGLGPLRERRGYDAPSDHFTRYEPELIREQAEKSLVVESVEGISMGWGMPGWSKWMARIPRPLADVAVRTLDQFGRQWPGLSDVIVLVGRPRRSESTSA
ncbi:MAG: methyltransferase domain-containing protein [Myxococcota bacterium]|nr:methyltransferase domain-containing protein [Myxococcota bacterium]